MLDNINDLLDQFRLGYISLDEMWIKVDQLLQPQDLKPTLKADRITKFKAKWYKTMLDV